MSEPGSLIRSLAGRSAARNFHSFVINELGAGIATGKFPQGSVLPNDAEMMSKFGVSRTVLREALKTLESKGLVEARPKVGTKVCPRGRWNHFDLQVLTWIFEAGPSLDVINQITAVRMALEPEGARAVARCRTANDIRLLTYWLRQMEKSAQTPLNFAISDYEFHAVLAEASLNNFMRSLLGVTEISHSFGYLKIVTDEAKIDPDILQVHADLLKAIESKDEEEAASLMAASVRLDHGLGLRLFAGDQKDEPK